MRSNSSLAKIENELDIIQKKECDTIINETNIDSIQVINSDDIHIGPKFIASTINYVDTTNKKSLVKYCIVFASLLILVAVILLFNFSLNEQRQPSTETPGPRSTTSTEPTGSPTTEPTTSTTGHLSCQLPEKWIYPYMYWSFKQPLNCDSIVNKQPWTISIDSVSQCEDVYALRDLQESSGLHHNFYISVSGVVYTGHDWSCSPDYNMRFSKTNIIIAICGEFNKCHELALKKLIIAGLDGGKIRQQYNVIPECCRGYPNRKGPGREVNNFLAKGSDPIIFPNNNCIIQPACK